MKRRWLALLLVAGAANAEDSFTVSELKVTPPLTAMAGGDFTAEATLVGEGALRASGGDFALEATVTPLSVTIVPVDVAVFLAVEGDTLVLTWSASGEGYVLESVAALNDAPEWQPVQPAPTERRFVTPLARPAVFFRLRRP
jgi:hypothetical protein